jgi:hypothetical protein
LRAISSRNSCSRRSRARRAAASGTEKQIDCSDEDCEISDTLVPCWYSAAKVRAAIPGTPSMPLPVTVSSACPPAAESALTGYFSSVRRAEISVPGAVGSANGRTNTGMFRPATGMSARGCSTLAPK